ncbi:unnamed protein product, partial [Prorocentrum cordatum]
MALEDGFPPDATYPVAAEPAFVDLGSLATGPPGRACRADRAGPSAGREAQAGGGDAAPPDPSGAGGRDAAAAGRAGAQRRRGAHGEGQGGLPDAAHRVRDLGQEPADGAVLGRGRRQGSGGLPARDVRRGEAPDLRQPPHRGHRLDAARVQSARPAPPPAGEAGCCGLEEPGAAEEPSGAADRGGLPGHQLASPPAVLRGRAGGVAAVRDLRSAGRDSQAASRGPRAAADVAGRGPSLLERDAPRSRGGRRFQDERVRQLRAARPASSSAAGRKPGLDAGAQVGRGLEGERPRPRGRGRRLARLALPHLARGRVPGVPAGGAAQAGRGRAGQPRGEPLLLRLLSGRAAGRGAGRQAGRDSAAGPGGAERAGPRRHAAVPRPRRGHPPGAAAAAR